MGQILHANARTTEAICREIHPKDSMLIQKQLSNGGREKIQKIYLWERLNLLYSLKQKKR